MRNGHKMRNRKIRTKYKKNFFNPLSSMHSKPGCYYFSKGGLRLRKKDVSERIFQEISTKLNPFFIFSEFFGSASGVGVEGIFSSLTMRGIRPRKILFKEKRDVLKKSIFIGQLL